MKKYISGFINDGDVRVQEVSATTAMECKENPVYKIIGFLTEIVKEMNTLGIDEFDLSVDRKFKFKGKQFNG